MASVRKVCNVIATVLFMTTVCSCSKPNTQADNLAEEFNERFKRHSLSELAQVYRVEQVTTQDIEGEPIAITGWQHCEHEECEISQAHKYNVGVTSKYGEVFGMNATAVFKLAEKSFRLGNAVATGVAIASEIELDSAAVARLMFTPKLKVIQGTMVKDARAWCVDDPIDYKASTTTTVAPDYEEMPGVECETSAPQVISRIKFSLTAPVRGSQLVSGGQVLGTWWVDYKPDSKLVDEKNFYIIRNKDMPNTLDKYSMRAGSPLMCAKSALKRAEKFAVWNAGICYIKQTGDGPPGLLATGSAAPIGTFNFAYTSVESSRDSRVRDRWVRAGKCDIIQEYAGRGFFCKRFPSARDTVMMFKKDATSESPAAEASRPSAYTNDVPLRNKPAR